MKIFLIIFLIIVSALPVMAIDQYPLVNSAVTQSAESVTYTYTLTNTTYASVIVFYVMVPSNILSSITSLTEPDEQWNIYKNTRMEMTEIAYRAKYAGIAHGDSAAFTISTLPGVPTSYNYLPVFENTNWQWYTNSQHQGNTVLPVPVPEPASLLALASGILGLGCFVRKRR